MNKNRFAVATFLVAGLASMVFADDPKKKTDAKDGVKTVSKGEKSKTVVKGEKPKASPGWVVLEEDWTYPFLDNFSTALHNAREHYRAKEDRSASAEIDKAIACLGYAQDRAEKSTAEDISTARMDLMDYSASLKSGKPVLARKLDNAFADAYVVLAKWHHFKSSKALDESDLKTAGRHLMAAADLLRNAAQSANLEYGTEAYDIYDSYAPYGYWDDEIVFEKGKLEANLSTIKGELQKLAKKLKKG
jgi:hypothetical protein